MLNYLFKNVSLNSELFGISPINVLFSTATIKYILKNFSQIFDFFDLLWLFLAISIAIRIVLHSTMDDTSKWKLKKVILKTTAVLPVGLIVFLSFCSIVYSGVSPQQYESVLLYNDEAYSLNELALQAIDKNNFLDAENLFKNALELTKVDSTKALIFNNLAYLYLNTGSTTKAIDSFEKALSYTINQSFDWNLIKGVLAGVNNEATSSLEYLNEAYKLRPGDFQVNHELTIFYLNVEPNSSLYNRDSLLKHAQTAFQVSRDGEVKPATANLISALTIFEKYNEIIDLFEKTNFEFGPEVYLNVGLAYINHEFEQVNINNEKLLKGKEYIDKFINMSKNDIPKDLEEKLIKIQNEISTSILVNNESLLSNQKLNIVDEKKINEHIQTLLTEYKKTTDEYSKGNISLYIGNEYSKIDDKNNATKFYRIAATHFPKDSADYFHSLAIAEWELGNGLGVIKYFEEGLSFEPNSDFLMNSYGVFLLGISSSSISHQNLNQAMEVNTKLVELNPDDENLLNLYLNYILIKDEKKAKNLIDKFKEFETAYNYHWIARAYHRIGNKVESEKYLKMSKDMGYVLDKHDTVYFSRVF